jgi:adenylate kinase
MRCIFVGIEYAGKTTLIELLTAYYQKRGRPVHGDDHFTLPDNSLSPESRAQAINFPNDVKERMQRMQIHYHIDVIKNYENTMIAGWHIEEAVYTAMYGDDPDSPYYPNFHYGFQRGYEAKVLEAHLPDVVLIHLAASDEAIRERMQADPHQYQDIKEKDIPEIKERFAEECEKSLFRQRSYIALDTTDRTPRESLDELLLVTEPMVTSGELAVRALPVPEDEFELRYENGVRKMVPKNR